MLWTNPRCVAMAGLSPLRLVGVGQTSLLLHVLEAASQAPNRDRSWKNEDLPANVQSSEARADFCYSVDHGRDRCEVLGLGPRNLIDHLTADRIDRALDDG